MNVQRRAVRGCLAILAGWAAVRTVAADPVRISVLHASGTAAQSGVYIPRNFARVGEAPFDQLRFMMRPITVSGGVPGGTVTLESSPSGAPFLLFNRLGAQVT